MMKGTNLLLTEVPTRCIIKVGKLGVVEFKEGYYVYVGSAMGGLEARINSHLKIIKGQHWHIDYLLKQGKICDIYYKESEKRKECEVAGNLCSHFESIRDFGSSDYKCGSHLFYCEDYLYLCEVIRSKGMKRLPITIDVVPDLEGK